MFCHGGFWCIMILALGVCFAVNDDLSEFASLMREDRRDDALFVGVRGVFVFSSVIALATIGMNSVSKPNGY